MSDINEPTFTKAELCKEYRQRAASLRQRRVVWLTEVLMLFIAAAIGACITLLCVLW